MDILQTGFSQGEPSISNDDELAAQVAGFLEQFLEVFGELKGSTFHVSGESVSYAVHNPLAQTAHLKPAVCRILYVGMSNLTKA